MGGIELKPITLSNKAFITLHLIIIYSDIYSHEIWLQLFR